MVSRTTFHQQQSDQSDPYGHWGHKSYGPLGLREVRELMERAKSRGSARMVYHVLLTHADCVGNVSAWAPDIARITGYQPTTVRGLLKDLRDVGDIATIRPGVGRRKPMWHITALATIAA